MQKTENLRKTFYDPNEENSINLIEFLQSVGGRQLKLEQIRHFLFKTSWTDREISLKARTHIQGGAIFLRAILEKGLDSSKSIDMLKTTIADIAPYVNQLTDSDDTSFILISTNTLPSTIHFKNAKSIFYEKELPADSKRSYDLDLLVLYALRLSLERRIHGILGIDYVLTSHNKPVGLNRLLAIAESLENVIYSDDVNWKEIKWVSRWLNHHMHRNLRPYPWIIHQSFEVLKVVLESRDYKTANVEGASFYGSSISYNLVHLRKEIEFKVLEEIPGAAIQWKEQHEIQVVR